MKSPVEGWSDARFKNWIISLLRRGTMRWPPKNECLKNAKTKRKKNSKTGRLAQHYKCNKCKKDFPLTQVSVDHKSPVVDPKTGFINFDVYIERMFCSLKGLQVLCKLCHDNKTKRERTKR